MTLYEKVKQSGNYSIHSDYVYIGQSSDGTIEIPLTGEQILSICTSGSNDLASEWVSRDEHVAEYMERYSDEQMVNVILEYGAWDEKELTNRQQNIERLVWLLAWDVFDDENPNNHLAIDEMQYCLN